MTSQNKGLLAALGAFMIWGLLPLYWKALITAIPLEIICHRITWSTLATLVLLVLWRKLGTLRSILRDKKVLLRFAITSILLSTNWLLYIWAVNNN